MQVYLVICDGDGNCIIARKREVNNFWKGSPTGEPTLVNGAGQWCLIGGKKHPGKTAEQTAQAEFEEETGLPLPNGSTFSEVIRNTNYIVIRCQVASAVTLADQIRMTISPSLQNPVRPSGDLVKDWELQEVLVVKASKLPDYLGWRVPLSPANYKGKLPSARRYSQDIDWFKDIGSKLAESPSTQ